MGELSTSFDWESAIEELDKKLIGFDFKEPYQTISDELTIKLIQDFFRWHQQNSEAVGMFSLDEMCAEIQNYNYTIVSDMAEIRLRHDPEFKYMLKDVDSEDDFQSTVDDLVSRHFESEAYSVYGAINEWLSDYSDMLYDGLEQYIADLLIADSVMFEIESSRIPTIERNKPIWRLFANNCQNTLFSEFSFAKTQKIADAPDDILVISNTINSNQVLAIEGGGIYVD